MLNGASDTWPSTPPAALERAGARRAMMTARRGTTLDPRLDLPSTPIQTVVALAFTRRSGHVLLSEDLRGTGLAGVPFDYLNFKVISGNDEQAPDQDGGPGIELPRPMLAAHIGRLRRRVAGHPKWRNTVHFSKQQLGRYLDSVAAHRTTSNGVFSLMTRWDQLESVLLAHGIDLDRWHAPVRWVHMVRGDEVAQAIERVRTLPGTAGSAYDAGAIMTALDEIEVANAWWERYFETHEITPFRVVYEDYRTTRSATLRDVLAWMRCDGVEDVEATASLSVDTASPERGGRDYAEESAAWRARFLADHAEFGGRTTDEGS